MLAVRSAVFLSLSLFWAWPGTTENDKATTMTPMYIETRFIISSLTYKTSALGLPVDIWPGFTVRYRVEQYAGPHVSGSSESANCFLQIDAIAAKKGSSSRIVNASPDARNIGGVDGDLVSDDALVHVFPTGAGPGAPWGSSSTAWTLARQPYPFPPLALLCTIRLASVLPPVSYTHLT